jgi:hypothetical protein
MAPGFAAASACVNVQSLLAGAAVLESGWKLVRQGGELCQRAYSRWLTPLFGALALFNVFGAADTLKNLSKSIAWIMGWYRAGIDALLSPLPFSVPPTVADLLVLYLVFASASVMGSRRRLWPPVAAAVILIRLLDKSERYHDRAVLAICAEGRRRNLESTVIVYIIPVCVVLSLFFLIMFQLNNKIMIYIIIVTSFIVFWMLQKYENYFNSIIFMKKPRLYRIFAGIMSFPFRWMYIQSVLINSFIKKILLVAALAMTLWGVDWLLLHQIGSLDSLFAQLPQPPPRR